MAGIIWELVLRQMSIETNSHPRFNARLFFYLFLPSTIYESASFLANKWFLLNLLPIIMISVIGTIVYSTALSITIYSLNHQDIFNFTRVTQLTTANFWQYSSESNISQTVDDSLVDTIPLNSSFSSANKFISLAATSTILSSPSSEQLNNLTLLECLLLSVVLKATDSSAILSSLKQLQLNERLYYLILGENVFNNGVVMILIALLMEFFGNAKVTVLKIYMTSLQFFITFVGSILLGISLATLLLCFVRIIKRFQSTTGYLNQSEAMVETLLLLKLAYLTYTLAAATGMSSIISLAAFSILNDQYIKRNLNLRSQLALRQVILAARIIAFSFIYPLMGMLLVEVAAGSQTIYKDVHLTPTSVTNIHPTNTSALMSKLALDEGRMSRSLIGDSTWNFKFLSIVLVLSVSYRFLTIFLFSSLSNLLSSYHLKTRLREQFLIAYGGFTSPLAIAIVQGLIEHEEYRETTMKNKYLFLYTVISITFITNTIFGVILKPLVVRIHRSLTNSGWLMLAAGSGTMDFQNRLGATKVFSEINNKVLGHLEEGLSSIVGRKRSSYDRMKDFNETYVKPWLTQSGSNTNWLSIFYDNLVLEETLNSNSFQIAPHDLTDLRASRRRSRLLTSVWRRKTWGSSLPITPMDTIEERSDKAFSSGQGRSASSKGIWQSRKPDSVRSSIRRRDVAMREPEIHLAKYSANSVSLKSPLPVDDDAMLKELVMLNLKQDNAERRRHSKRHLLEKSLHSNQNVSSNNLKHVSISDCMFPIGSEAASTSYLRTNRYDTRTISSASTTNTTLVDDFVGANSTSESQRTRKQTLFFELEQNLDDRSIDILRALKQFDQTDGGPSQNVNRSLNDESDLNKSRKVVYNSDHVQPQLHKSQQQIYSGLHHGEAKFTGIKYESSSKGGMNLENPGNNPTSQSRNAKSVNKTKKRSKF